MNNSHILKKSTDIIKYTGDIVLQEIKSGRQVTVIFPNRRPVYFLSQYISDAYKTAVGSVKMFSIDDFIDACWESSDPAIFYPYAKVNPAEAVFLLFDLNKNPETRLIKSAEKLDVFMPWGYKLFGDFEELLIETADPSSCDAVIAEKINPEFNLQNFSDKFAKFSKMYKTFYEILVKSKFTSRSYRYKTFAEKIAENPDVFQSVIDGRVIIAGFYGITASEAVIFKNLLKNNGFNKENQTSVVSKTGASDAEFLSKIGLKPSAAVNETAKGEEYKYKHSEDYRKLTDAAINFYFHKVSSVHNEIARLKEIIDKSEKKLSSKDLIVLSKEEYLFPLIHNVLNSLDKGGYNISIGYSLNRTPVYTLFNLLSVLHGRKKYDKFYAKDYISLFLHPYVKNISGKLHGLPQYRFDAVQTRTLFQSIESYIKNNKILFISVKEIENALTSFTSEDSVKAYLAEMHGLFISNFENIENIKDFIEKIIKIIDAVSHNSSADKHPYGSKFIESALKAVMEFDGNNFGHYKFDGISGYFNLLKNLLKRQKVPFKGTPLKGLQVLGPLEARNINFDRIFYLGANEGILPDVSKENTVLTEDVRRFLNLADAGESSKIQEYNFLNLVSGAKEVYLFYNDSSRSEKSRFVEKIIWDIQKKTNNLKEPKVVNSAFKINFNKTEQFSIKKSREVKDYLCGIEYSAAKLDTYLKCPSMFYYGYVLNLRERGDIGEDIDAAGIGSVIHSVLNEYFKTFEGKEYAVSNLEEEKIKIGEILSKKFNDRGSMVLNLQKKQILTALNFFIEKRKKDLDGAKIIGSEYPLEGTAKVNLTGGGEKEIKLSGRSDLIIEKSGEHFIIDYKTGGSLICPDKNFIPAAENRDEWLKRIKSVQLPLYIILYSAFKSVGHSDIAAKLWGIKKNEERLIDLKDVKLLNAYENFIAMLIEDIINSDNFDFVKKESDKKKICGFCSYSVLCGIII
ncbi:MAG: PD-(D/E)XK nuclease family protein [Candidatus Acidulodesulfobacterium sp.]